VGKIAMKPFCFSLKGKANSTPGNRTAGKIERIDCSGNARKSNDNPVKEERK